MKDNESKHNNRTSFSDVNNKNSEKIDKITKSEKNRNSQRHQ
jgi:hypothetical protein